MQRPFPRYYRALQ